MVKSLQSSHGEGAENIKVMREHLVCFSLLQWEGQEREDETRRRAQRPIGRWASLHSHSQM